MRASLSTRLTSQLFCLLSVTLTVIGCAEPWCVPGRSVECACIGGGKGAQTCAPSGQQYLQCICPELTPAQGSPAKRVTPQLDVRLVSEEVTPAPVKSIVTTQPSVVSKLVSSPIHTSDRGAPSDEEVSNTHSSLQLAPIKISRNSDGPPSEGQGKRQWWLIKESTQSCELSDDLKASTHPAQLLAQGCYTKLSSHGKMRIKCDSAPMGPKTYLFAESHARCREILKPPSRELPSDFQRSDVSAQPPAQLIKQSPDLAPSPSSSRATSRGLKDTWHCMCYQEVFQGEPAESTACRKTRDSCLDLEQKVAEGSPILVKGSMTVGCKRIKAKEPWDLFGVRYQWLHSSQPGAWWSPRGCFLNPSAKRRTTTSRPSVKRPSTPTQPAERLTSTKPLSKLPSAITQLIEEDSRCAEACWAQLAREGERLQRFKQRAIPSSFDFAAQYARRVNLIVETCEARKKQQKSSSYRKECLRGGVKACTKLCERAQ